MGEMKRFRLLRGKYVSGNKADAKNPRRTYNKGDLIETEVDLTKFNGPPPMQPKFARADDYGAPGMEAYSQPPTARELEKLRQDRVKGTSETLDEPEVDATDSEDAEDGLDDYTVAQLKEYAANEEIDLEGATRKEDILRAIREELQTR